ncbi:hypothetical protein [Phenylobacterium sp.]|uniref:hypothetical protein n=1 Tax=Phenylobacterium sp. TaxID=1871053 RepID=UPI00286A1573|nr:hypothetical protein [Phenylobacterium sp.]
MKDAPRRPRNPRVELRGFIEELKKLADLALEEKGQLAPGEGEDRGDDETVRRVRERLDWVPDELFTLLRGEGFADASTADHYAYCVHSALGAAFVIGSRTTISNSASAADQRLRVQTARDAKKAQDAPKRSWLRATILREAGRAELEDTDKFAESLRDGVLLKLNENAGITAEEGWPSVSTIRRAVRDIMADAQKNPGSL